MTRSSTGSILPVVWRGLRWRRKDSSAARCRFDFYTHDLCRASLPGAVPLRVHEGRQERDLALVPPNAFAPTPLGTAARSDGPRYAFAIFGVNFEHPTDQRWWHIAGASNSQEREARRRPYRITLRPPLVCGARAAPRAGWASSSAASPWWSRAATCS